MLGDTLICRGRSRTFIVALWFGAACIASVLWLQSSPNIGISSIWSTWKGHQTSSSRPPLSQYPTAQVLNGTYVGRREPLFQQDLFLGVAYAKPPTGELRFRPPVSLDSTWDGVRRATEYSNACIGYGLSSAPLNYRFSEDCLYLNIVRPSSKSAQLLPVLVFIHGGGYTSMGTEDMTVYNMSYIVRNSADFGIPIVAVSINYRLTSWGFLFSREIAKSGNTNLGLRDQRLALHWIRENIDVFGGDPERITLWGESAGAASAGLQMVAYGGRDDSLFRAVVLQSGSPVTYHSLRSVEFYDPKYRELVENAGCGDREDSLACLRAVPTEKLSLVMEDHWQFGWYPTIDGDFIQRYPSSQLESGDFVHVPIIAGANTDEGTIFTPLGIENKNDFIQVIKESAFHAKPTLDANQTIVYDLLEAYPNDPCIGSPACLGCSRPGKPWGKQFRRAASYIGDAMFVANRRLVCETWASAGLAAFCYRFNATSTDRGVSHASELGVSFGNYFVMASFLAKGEIKNPAIRAQAQAMNRFWINFAYFLDPNGDTQAQSRLWPKYEIGQETQLVFEKRRIHTERDDFRASALRLINRLNLDYGR